jgi:hypothetical protein
VGFSVGLGWRVDLPDCLSRRGPWFRWGSPEFEHECPVGGVALAFPFAAGPAFEVANGSVAIDAGDAVWVGDGPLVAVEAAAAEANQGGFAGETVLLGELEVKFFPEADGGGAAEEVGGFEVGDVVAFGEQGDIRCGFVAKELAVPDPGAAGSGAFGVTMVARCPATSNSYLV